MQKYSDWSPTRFDTRGLALSDRQDWLVVPVLRTRDSGPLAQSNFETAEIMLGTAGEDDYELHSFNHWGPGWFDILIVRPGSKCADVAEEIEKALEDYPILDEMDYSEREYNEKCEIWEKCYDTAERIELCKRAGASIFAARRDELPEDVDQYIEVAE